jgi:hypothetical protein
MRLPAAALALFSSLLPAALHAQTRSVSLAGRISYDRGGVFVSGTGSGTGGGLGLRLSFGDDRAVWEVGAELDVAGYEGEGDGDPIFMGTVLLSHRAFSDGDGVRAYWTVGVGAGGLAIAGSGFVLPFKLGAGVSLGHLGPAGLEIGVFNRFNLILTGGDPGRDYLNSVGVEAAIRFGR